MATKATLFEAIMPKLTTVSGSRIARYLFFPSDENFTIKASKHLMLTELPTIQPRELDEELERLEIAGVFEVLIRPGEDNVYIFKLD